MIFRENKGALVSQKEVMDNIEVKKEMLTIRLFDGLFRSSDNILRNILVGVNNRLISIDEGDIFGKRGHIFDKNDWCLKDSWCRENVEDVINTCVLGEGKKELVINRLVEYGYAPGMVEKYGRPGATDNEGFDPYRDSVGPGIYGGIVKRDEDGEIVIGRQYQNHNPRPGPVLKKNSDEIFG